MFHIVDDEIMILEYLSVVLEELGFSTKTFECPEKYVNYVKSSDYESPVSVFTDISMPVMTGYEMIEAVSEIIPNLKFVVMTGQPFANFKNMEKACMYLSKPFLPKDIEPIVDKLKECHASKPCCVVGCDTIGNSDSFPLKDWECPHLVKENAQ